MNKFTICIALLFLATPIFSQVIDKKAEQIVNKLAEKTKSYQSLKIDFSYEMVNQKQKINEKLDGNLWIKGDKYRISLLGQIIICDGKTIWSINEEINEVQISNLDPADEESSPVKLLTSYDKNYRPKFIRENTEDGRVVQVIDLTPNQGKSFYKIRLVIDKNLCQIISSSVYDKDQTVYTYTVKKFEPNARLADSVFVFDKSKYPDIEIIDMR